MAKKNRKKYGQFFIPELQDSCKSLLANIRFSELDSPIKSIMVTSSLVDEGKSTVASNLACAIASGGKRVLLIDCDMRRRSLGAMLGRHAKFGMYAVLAGQASLNDAIIKTEYPNLYFMDNEPNVPNPPDILSAKRFAALVKRLEETFDYVLIDTPPLGLFVDAAIVSRLVDGVVLCVRQNRTKIDIINRSVQQLKTADANILGIVTTFTKEAESDYYYAYYNEEGKRSKKKQKDANPGVVYDNAIATSSDVKSWAKEVGVASKVPQVMQNDARNPESPYAAGAFKKADR